MSESVVQRAAPITYTGPDAERRLAELGIHPDRLRAALDAGDIAARQADEFHPVMAAGTFRWHATVGELRRGLAEDGWTSSDPRNSPRVTDLTGTNALVPVRGDADTGVIPGDPRTARPRGTATARSVQINGQLEFDFTPWLADQAGERDTTVKTWFLLYHYSTESNELRAELSLPTHIREKGIVDGWSERIVLPAHAFGPDVAVPRDAGGDTDVEFDIEAI